MKLFVRIPTADTIDRDLSRWLIWLAREQPEADIDILQSNLGTAEARNIICELFLESKATHLWMLDSDVIPPYSLHLLEGGEKYGFVNGLYQHLTPAGLMWDAWERVRKIQVGTPRFRPWPEPYPAARYFQVDAVGGGCMLIRRDVIEGLAEQNIPWFETTFPEGSRQRPMGEDFNFCQRLWVEKVPVMVDQHYHCGHTKAVDYRLFEKWIRR